MDVTKTETNQNHPRARAKIELDDACAAEITAAKFRLLNDAAHLAELEPDADSFMLRGTVDGRTLVVRVAVGDNDA